MTTDYSFKEFLNLIEGPTAAQKPQQDLVYRALGIKPKHLKHGVFSGAQIGPDEKNLSGVKVFSVDDVDATRDGRIKSVDIDLMPTDKTSGIEDQVKKGDQWYAKLKKDSRHKKKTAGKKWWDDVQGQAQSAPAPSGALPMTPGMM